MKLTFVVPGKPVGKARPKFARRGNFVTTYTPEATVNYENWIRTCFVQKYSNFVPLETPLRLTLDACFVRSKSNKMPYPMIKPDADNILKAVGDSLNGIAYKDDKQIVGVKMSKFFGDIEKIQVTIEEL